MLRPTFFYILLFHLTTFTLQAQERKGYITNYTFDSIPTCDCSPEEYKENGAVILRERTIADFFHNDKGALEMNFIYQRTIRLISDKSVDQFNKIYVPLNDVTEIVDIRARFISKEGKITEVEKTDMKPVENLEEAGNYKVFAIVGAEPGGIIDYFYIIRKAPLTIGHTTLQSELPICNSEFKMITPNTLKLVTKSYNGYPELTEETDSIQKKTILSAHMDKIPGQRDEPYSAWKANLMRVEFFFGYNFEKNRTRIYSYNTAASHYFDLLLQLEKQEMPALKKIYKSIKLDEKASSIEKIKQLEIFLKLNYQIKNQLNDDGDDLSFIEKNKMTSNLGMMKLFVNILESAKIPYEIIITCDRSERKFDKDFDSWNFLDDFLIYLPSVNQFLYPTDATSRLGLIPAIYTATSGLSLKPATISNVKTLLPNIRKIPAVDFSINGDSIFVNAIILPDFSSVKADARRVVSGYNASYIQAVWEYTSDDYKKKTIHQYLGFDNEHSKIENDEVLNGGFETSLQKPFIIKGTVTNSYMIENAGQDYIFNVGMLIGTQVEMYDSVPRKLSVENDYNRHYYRSLQINIPEGYAIVNPEKLAFNISIKDEENITSAFISTYKMDDHSIHIIIDEFYKQLFYPLEDYEKYRSVINAAADFNNVKLVFRKK